jgi:hypothetical protein
MELHILTSAQGRRASRWLALFVLAVLLTLLLLWLAPAQRALAVTGDGQAAAPIGDNDNGWQPPLAPSMAAIWFEVDNPAGNLQAALNSQLEQLGQVGPGYDTSVVVRLRLTGEVAEADYEYMRSLPALTSLDVSGVTSELPEFAFANLEQLIDIRLAADAQIREQMLRDCIALTTLSIGNGPAEAGVINLSNYANESMGEQAFTGCLSITKVRLAPNVVVPTYCFSSYHGLYDYRIPGLPGNPSTIESIVVGDRDFIPGVADLRGYTADEFGRGAFLGSWGVDVVRFPEGVPISDELFYDCGLTAMEIGDDEPVAGEMDLRKYRHAEIGDIPFYCNTEEDAGEALSPNTITTVRFPDNCSLSSFNIFYHFGALTTMTVGDSPLKPGIIDLMAYDYVAPGQTQPHLGQLVFDSCVSLTTVLLPGDIILDGGFGGCESLTTLSLGKLDYEPGVVDLSNYQGDTWGLSMFAVCESITTVKLPGNLALSTQMFMSCGSLNTLSLDDATPIPGVIDLRGYIPTAFGTSAFTGCAAIKCVYLPATARLGSAMFNWCSGIEELRFFGSGPAPAVGNNVFYEYAKPGTVYYPAGASGYEPGVFAAPYLDDWDFVAYEPIVEPPTGAPGSGDFDGDNRVTMTEVITTLNVVIGRGIFTPAQKASVDMDGDGVVTMTDVIKVLRRSIGLDV